MIYLIFRNNNFVGYARKKKILKSFLKSRGFKNYDICKVSDIDTTGVKDIEDRELRWNPLYKMALFDYELDEAKAIALGRIEELGLFYSEIKKMAKYIKFGKKERKILAQFFIFIQRILEDLDEDGESCVTPDEYFDMKELINYVVLKH